jgi:cell division ATPase FtsA
VSTLTEKRAMECFIKIGANATDFVVFNYGRIVFWSNVNIGEDLILSDVSECLRLKLQDEKQIKKAKGINLTEGIGFTKDDNLDQKIADRIKTIFERIKDELNIKGYLQKVDTLYISKEDNYLPNIDEILQEVLGIKSEMIDMNNIYVVVKSKKKSIVNQISQIYNEIF